MTSGGIGSMGVYHQIQYHLSAERPNSAAERLNSAAEQQNSAAERPNSAAERPNYPGMTDSEVPILCREQVQQCPWPQRPGGPARAIFFLKTCFLSPRGAENVLK